MALAVLTLLHSDGDRIDFKIDTGTNKYYYLKIGKSVADINGIKWVGDIISKTPLRANKSNSPFFDSSFTESLEKNLFERGDCYIQLFTFKDQQGKSPGFSRVIKVNTGTVTTRRFTATFSIPDVQNDSSMGAYGLNNFRNIPHSDISSRYATQSSLEEILAGVARMAAPIVMGLLNGNAAPAAAGTAQTGTTGTPALGMFNTILDSILRGLTGGVPAAAPAAASTAAAPPAQPANPPAATPRTGAGTAQAHSLSFSASHPQQYSRPFIFGIDDAIFASLVGSVAGPVLQAIPQILNANNQARLQNKQANNRLVTDLVADVNRRMMLQQFLQNQSANTAASPNITQLLQLLQQMPEAAPAPAAAAAAPAPAPAAAAPARAESLSVGGYVQTLSDKTVLSFEHGTKQQFWGKDRNVYKSGAIILRMKFNVMEPAPKNPLPKAIIGLTIKDNKQNTVFTKIYKQKDVMPNSKLDLQLSSDEVSKLPQNTELMVIAELRWLTSQKREYKTMGNTEIVLAGEYFVKEQGKFIDEARELADMKTYRSFWNKVWESPVADKVSEEGKQYGWDLDGNLKYTMLLSADHESNGIMDTKKIVATPDSDSVKMKIEARMKGGMELSISELNKMATLWDKKQPLPAEKLAALKSPNVAANNASEFIYNIKMKGKRGERGLAWVVPILKPASFSLARTTSTDETGQIIAVQEELAQLALPYAARVLGLKSA